MPPWHPILRDRWKSLDVPSFNKSTYQSDFTPQVATQECRKPVYLARREKKDPCQELSETFQTWRKTSKGPSHTHEVCEKPKIVDTTIVCREPVPSSKEHHHQDSCYRRADINQLHGPDCEKHCFSAPLMCHVKSSKSHGDEHHVVYCHGDGNILDQMACNNAQAHNAESITEGRHHMGLLDCQAVEIPPSQKGHESSAHINLHDGISKADDGNKCLIKDICHPDAEKRHSCQNYTRHSINPLVRTRVAMHHPSGDGCDYVPVKKQHHLPEECSKDISHNHISKRVHFAQEPEVCCDPSISRSELYHSDHNAHNMMKSCLMSRPTTNSNNFTLCEDVTNNQPRCWWKRTSCLPQRNHVDTADVPQDVTKPFCPSYLTIHKRDYTEPCPNTYRLSNTENKALSAECGCTGNMNEKFICPEFERGGLI